MARYGFQGRFLLDSGGSLRAQVIFRASRMNETKTLSGSYSGDWGAWWAAQEVVSSGFSMLRAEQCNSLATSGRGTVLVRHLEVASIRRGRRMRAFCVLGMGATASVISSGPVKKVSTFKVKGFLV